jgi:hypothetical protein
VPQIAIEGLDEEDRLRVLGRNVLYGIRVQQLQPDGVQRVDGIVAQELFDRAQLTVLDDAANSMAFIPNDDTIRFWQLLAAALWLYDA